MSIPTDQTPLEAPKNPDTDNVFALIKFFAQADRTESIRQKYLAGWYGYGHAKFELLEIMLEFTAEFRKKRALLESDFSQVEKILERGNNRANQLAEQKYLYLKDIIGL
jgi:tryptophanyl-tRNA synthetase